MNINKNFFAAILIVIAALFASPLKAQVTFGAQTAPQPFSLLELTTTKIKAGLRLPYVTTAQRDSIAHTSTFVSNPLAGGLVLYNKDINCVEYWNLTQWVSICAEPPCVAPAAPGAMTLKPATPIVTLLNGTFTATVPNVAGMIYTWTLPAGLTGSSTTNSITITGATPGTYDASAITVTATNCCGATSAATAGTGTGNICVGAALRPDILASVTLGTYTWSTKNVNDPGAFTANAGDLGMLYPWDRKIGWSSSDPMTSIPSGQTWNSTGSSNPAWDLTNHNPCPTGWTVPATTTFTDLNNTGSVWIDACTAATLGLGTHPGRVFGTTTPLTAYADFDPNTMLFLPVAGFRQMTDGSLQSYSSGYYWTSDPGSPPNSLYFYISQISVINNVSGLRASAMSVRCVQCTAPAAPGVMTLTPAAPVVTLLNGTFTATVPNVAGMTYTWTLPAGLTGTSTTNSITITGAATGSYDASAIKVTATNASGCTSAATAGTGTGNICVGAALRPDILASVTLGTYTWSTKNVDAPGTFTANAGDPGMFYQWDSKTGWSSSDPLTSIPSGQTWNSTGSSATTWDLTNHNPCPTGWSVPTNAQLTALSNTGKVWVDACTAANLGLGTMAGLIFGTTTVPTYTTFNPNSMLFLPAAGGRYISPGYALGDVGRGGGYWSSVQNSVTTAWFLTFLLNNNANVNSNGKVFGWSVRCVTP